MAERRYAEMSPMERKCVVGGVRVLWLEDGVDLLVTGSLAGEGEGAVLLHLLGGT